MSPRRVHFPAEPKKSSPVGRVPGGPRGNAAVSHRSVLLAMAVVMVLVMISSSPVTADDEEPELARGVEASTAYAIDEFGSVNLFSGDMMLPVTLGPAVPVSPDLSLGLSLVYNSNAWDVLDDYDDGAPICFTAVYADINDESTVLNLEEQLVDFPVPGRLWNAGLGWRLGLAQLFAPGEEPFIGDEYASSTQWIFVSEDAGTHRMQGSHHHDDAEVTGVSYSIDGTQLRLLLDRSGADCFGGGPCHLVERPDGTVLQFEWFGGWPLHRLTAASDRYGNHVQYSYNDAAAELTIRDASAAAGTRQIVVKFSDSTYKKVLSVKKKAFGGSNAVYTFQYKSMMVLRPQYPILAAHCSNLSEYDPPMQTHHLCGEVGFDKGIPTMYHGTNPSTGEPICELHPSDELVAIEVLERVIRPDGSYHEFEYDTKGRMAAARAPTRQTVAWTWGFNAKGARREQIGFHQWRVKFFSTMPMSKRLFRNQSDYRAGAAPIAEWSWETLWASGPGRFNSYNNRGRCWIARKAIDPEGNYVINYFQMGEVNNIRNDVGLPYTYCNPEDIDDIDWTNGPFLSKEVYAKEGDTFIKLRSELVEYEHEHTGHAYALSFSDHRLIKKRTVYHRYDESGAQLDDYWVETSYSDYDGVGHYRSAMTTASSNYPYAGASFSSYTNYNPGAGAMYTPDVSSPWILDLYDEKTVSQGGQSATTRYCFDADTGFLDGTRSLRGDAASGTDLVTRYYPHATALGFAGKQELYGGDGQNVGTLGGCEVNGSARYQLNYDYEYGSLAAKVFKDCHGTPILRAVNNTIDVNTGLVATSARPDGYKTVLHYDTMGRLVTETPDDGAPINHSYQFATWDDQNDKEVVRANRYTRRQADLTEHHYYDQRGLLFKELSWLPDGTQVQRLHTYDALGRTTSKSLWQRDGDTVLATTYQDYDPFGRAQIITKPDGKRVITRWQDLGDWQSMTTVNVRTENGLVPTRVIRHTDARGQLVKLEEDISKVGDVVTSLSTTYRYDEGGRLVLVCVNDTDGDPANGCTGQPRSFNYDDAGLLMSESHPETGSFSYSYGAMGEMTSRQSPTETLFYEYDGAGRPTFTRDGTNSILTQLRWGKVANNRGKLVGSVQNNPIGTAVSGDSDGTVTISEQFSYSGKGKRLSERTLTSSTGLSFTTKITDYDELGNITRIEYPTCSAGRCRSTGSGNTVGYVYRKGLLQQVQPVARYVSEIGYHPDGAISEIHHGNGIVDTRQRPADTWKPLSRITAGSLWDSGEYSYDAAGNIIAIGAETYRYDLLGRLTRGEVNPRDGTGLKSQTLSYDRYGNIKTMSTGGDARTFGVNAATNRLNALSYDGKGRVTSINGLGLSYDDLDRVMRVGSDIYHVYSSAGERVATFDKSADTETWTVRGGENQVLSRFKRAGDSWVRDEDYIYAGSLRVAAEVNGVGVRHFHLDHLGSTRLISDVDGHKVTGSELTFYPFGESTAEPGANTDEMQFTGHERDDYGNGQNKDLDYMHARYFSPYFGRFMSADPEPGKQESGQSWNRYAYARNNPILKIDPNGKADLQSLKQMTTKSNQTALMRDIVIQKTPIWVQAVFETFTGIPVDEAMAPESNEQLAGQVVVGGVTIASNVSLFVFPEFSGVLKPSLRVACAKLMGLGLGKSTVAVEVTAVNVGKAGIRTMIKGTAADGSSTGTQFVTREAASFLNQIDNTAVMSTDAQQAFLRYLVMNSATTAASKVVDEVVPEEDAPEEDDQEVSAN